MLILVRHGRTASNAGGLLQGRADNPLDEVGERQVREVAQAIGRVDRVISSSLLRARQTAAMFTDAPSVVDDRWIELDYGEYDGRPLADVPSHVWSSWREDLTFAPPGGESMGALNERVFAAAADAFELSRTATVVVISHVSPIKAAMAWALGGDPRIVSRLLLDQAAVCRIVVGGAGTPVVRSFNEILYAR